MSVEGPRVHTPNGASEDAPSAPELTVDPASRLSASDAANLYLELWKQTVTVQQHFNDLEWRIRGLALTALTFALGAAAVAAKDGTRVGGGAFLLATALLIVGLVLWCAFWIVDQVWYHPLLIGSVRHGEALETELRAYAPAAGLTGTITRSSPWRPRLYLRSKGDGWAWRPVGPALHSSGKMRIFYGLGTVTLLASAVLLQLTVGPATPVGPRLPDVSSSPSPTSATPRASPLPGSAGPSRPSSPTASPK